MRSSAAGALAERARGLVKTKEDGSVTMDVIRQAPALRRARAALWTDERVGVRDGLLPVAEAFASVPVARLEREG